MEFYPPDRIWVHDYKIVSFKCQYYQCVYNFNLNNKLCFWQAQFPLEHFRKLRIVRDADQKSEITSLPDGIFGPITFEEIYMSNNQLKTIGDNVFQNMNVTLRIVQISFNEIKQFPFDHMSSFTKIVKLVLSNNKLTLMANLNSKTLSYIDLNNNVGLYFSGEEFIGAPNLSVIRLHNIGMEHVSPNLFVSQKKASSVDLSNNHIEALETDSFHFEGSTLKSLNLEYNKIVSLDPETITGMYNIL